MIGLHEIVEHVEIVRPIAVKKNPVALPKLRFETYNEGKAAQKMLTILFMNPQLLFDGSGNLKNVEPF